MSINSLIVNWSGWNRYGSPGNPRSELGLLPAIARRVPTAIPEPRFAGKPEGGFPWPFLGYADRRALATALGSFLGALHRIEIEPLMARGLEIDRIGRLDHERRLALTTKRLHHAVDRGWIENAHPFLDFMIRTAPDGTVPRPVLVHGDLYSRHLVLGKNNRLAGVIDWGDMHAGHPALDLAAVYYVLGTDFHDDLPRATARLTNERGRSRVIAPSITRRRSCNPVRRWAIAIYTKRDFSRCARCERLYLRGDGFELPFFFAAHHHREIEQDDQTIAHLADTLDVLGADAGDHVGRFLNVLDGNV